MGKCVVGFRGCNSFYMLIYKTINDTRTYNNNQYVKYTSMYVLFEIILDINILFDRQYTLRSEKGWGDQTPNNNQLIAPSSVRTIVTRNIRLLNLIFTTGQALYSYIVICIGTRNLSLSIFCRFIFLQVKENWSTCITYYYKTYRIQNVSVT